MLKNNCITLQGRDGTVQINRNSYGIPEISAISFRDCSYGMGLVHASDRLLRMLLSRTILEGRSAEIFNFSEDLIRADYYIRSLNLYPDIDKQKQLLEREVRESSESYAEGVNYYFDNFRISPDLKFLKSAPEPWRLEDTMRLAKLFFSFQAFENHSRLTKLIIRMINCGIDEERLKELFPAITDPVDIELLKKVTVFETPDSATSRWLANIPAFISGNAWAVSGRHAVGGMPIFCTDHHLELNRTPSVWHEVMLRLPDNVITGFTIPGIPCVITGRNRNLAFSGINSFPDMTDFRIEECRAGKYRRGNIWHHFDVRREFIKTNNGENIKTEFYENEHGILEGDPFTDGFYLVRRWAAGRNCGAHELNVLHNVMRSKTVREAMKHYRELDAISFNFVMADTAGNIGSQMSGRVFNRPSGTGGLVPLPAWDRRYDSRGFVAKNRLRSLYNPLNGMVIAADNHQENPEGPDPEKTVVPGYRFERIHQMLRKRKKSDTEYMKEIQYDLSSLQAERFMKIIFPLVDFKRKGRILKEWDMEYRSDSAGASIFENIYFSMLETVFGSRSYGREFLNYFFSEPYFCIGYYMNPDRIFFNKKSHWFGSESRDALLKIAVENGLEKRFSRYGKKQRIIFSPLLSDDTFFSALKYIPYRLELSGGISTVNFCRIFEPDGRKTTVGASCRIIADMAADSLLTNTTGGSSTYPGYYKNNNMDWHKGIYKKLS